MMRSRWGSWIGAAALWLLAAGPAVAQGGDEREQAWAKADRLEARGDFAGAADTLVAIAEVHDQDYAVQLQVAWLRFRAEQFRLARRYYRRAYLLSQGSLETTLGLGWCSLRLGEIDRARLWFERALREAPEMSAAKRGMAAVEEAEAARHWYAYLFAGASVRAGEAAQAGRLSAGAALGAEVASRAVGVGVTYRVYGFEESSASTANGGDAPNRRGQSGGGRLRLDHQLYGALAFHTNRAGLSLHGAHVGSGLDGQLRAQALGVMGRLSTFGDATLEASHTWFPDTRIWRFAPAWRLPLGLGLYLRPSGSAQLARDLDEPLAMGALGVGWRGASVTLEGGGAFGREWRPTYLASQVVYNLDVFIIGSGWLIARVEFGEGAALVGHYAIERYDPERSRGRQRAHVVSLGLRLRAF